MNRNLWLLALCQGLFLTNNVVFIAINGLVGWSLAPLGWMATLPVMGYVVGGALATSVVAKSQLKLGRKRSFQLGLWVGLFSAAVCAYAVVHRQFWLLLAATVIAGYYNANAQLYRFAAAELSTPQFREKAVSLVMAGGLIGAIAGPNLAARTRTVMEVPFAGAYIGLMVVAVLGLIALHFIEFEPTPKRDATQSGRSLGQLMRQPQLVVATMAAALGYGVMNLLMAATPIAMQLCGLGFDDAAIVLEWHVIGMFAPGFFTGHLIKRFGTLTIMGVGVALNFLCIAVALAGLDFKHFLVALFFLGVGWNFIFTGSTTLSLSTYQPNERDTAQGAINFFTFITLAASSFASGALITSSGWQVLNLLSLVLVTVIGLSLLWLARHRKKAAV